MGKGRFGSKRVLVLLREAGRGQEPARADRLVPSRRGTVGRVASNRR